MRRRDLLSGMALAPAWGHPNLVELPNGDFALPYMGYNVPHKYPRGQWQLRPGYMIWPKGRLVALEATGEGEFATVRIFPPGRKLRLNVLTKRARKVLTEVARGDGQPIPGRTFADADIFLRFRLDQSQIFGVDFE